MSNAQSKHSNEYLIERERVEMNMKYDYRVYVSKEVLKDDFNIAPFQAYFLYRCIVDKDPPQQKRREILLALASIGWKLKVVDGAKTFADSFQIVPLLEFDLD